MTKRKKNHAFHCMKPLDDTHSTCPLVPSYKEDSPAVDRVNHPAHYTRGGIEAIDVIEAWGLGFCPGNAVKYLARYGHKEGVDPLEDLRKARWYIDREIARHTKTKET